MRTIKFRAMRRSGEWVYGGFSRRWNDHPCIVVYNPTERKDDHGSYEDNWDIYVDMLEDTVCQFTGYHDVDGTEIYEGDIVSVRNSVTAMVEWRGGGFHFYGLEDVSGRRPDYLPSPANQMKVISNIYEKGGSDD